MFTRPVIEVSRCAGVSGRHDLADPNATPSQGPLLGLACSRLGHDPHRLRRVCRFLRRSILECRDRDGCLLVAVGSAIEPWALRAAELFRVPVFRIQAEAQGSADESVDNDAALIATADRVDVLHVRARGRIHRHIRERLIQQPDASTRIAVSDRRDKVALELISLGAIGWYERLDAGPPTIFNVNETAWGSDAPADRPEQRSEDQDGWVTNESDWLIHCTRSPRRTWPGETLGQYMDGLIVGSEECCARSPLDALLRIVRSRRLVGSAIATQDRVVCFSSRRLLDALSRRRYRPHLQRWDYEPYGVGIVRRAATREGVRPVVYGTDCDRKLLSRPDQFRFQSRGSTYDWREEREWRCLGTLDLNRFDASELRVFAMDTSESRVRLADCQWPVTFISQTEIDAYNEAEAIGQ